MRALLLAALFSTLALAGQPTAQTLPNGLKVIVEEDHDIPNVAMYFFYKVGSRNERPGITGVSHFFEHMMFNGAKKYGPGDFDTQMEKNGGNNNAYTTRDVTVYTDWFPRPALELIFDMEADRIRDLAFDPKIVESERGVVYSERRTSVDNNNHGALFEQLNAAAMEAHPYHWPVVGWASDIESWTLGDLKNHFRMGYAPNNCTMVVVGDVNTSAIFDLAKKYLGTIPPRDPPPPVVSKEPAQTGERRVVLRKQAQLPVQLIAYHIPESRHADTPALHLLDAILSEGDSSRLEKRLINEGQLAISVGINASSSLDPYLFTIFVEPRSGIDPAETERVVLEELERLRTAEVPAGELRKAKNQLLAHHYREMKTIVYRANLLGTYDVFFGDFHRLTNVPGEIEAVTPADILRVAKQYFAPEQRTVATLIPETSSPTQVTK